MKEYVDQMGSFIKLRERPQRIISLVPSQTELLFYLGLASKIVGITKFCVHPRELVGQYPKVGGTKNINIEKIDELQPDLIIGNKEENTKEDIEEIRKKYPVWMSDVNNLRDALDMIYRVGDITGVTEKGVALQNSIQTEFKQLTKAKKPKKTLYLIWNDPIMVAGTNTFINEMLGCAGYVNLITTKRYPEISQEEVIKLNPEIILLSSEPFPFKEKHVLQFKSLCPNAEVKIVDGEMFSWYGSRLKHTPSYFRKAL